jgi:polyhydroxybutyrate depolymerase
MPSMRLRPLALFGVLGALAVGCSGGTTPNENLGSTGASVSGANASTGSPSSSTGANAGTAGGTGGSGATSGGVAGTTPTGADSGSVGGTAGTSSGSGTGVTSGVTAGTSTGASPGVSGAAAGGDGGSVLMTMSDGGRPSGMSAGCGQPPPSTEPIGMAVLHTMDITGLAQEYVAGYTHRVYCTTIPKGYVPTQAYPVVFYGPGCGATACEGSSFTGRTDIFYVQAISSADAKGANLVPTGSSPGCFQTGRTSTVDSPELNYFDQVMAQVQATYCVDKGRTFAAGTSSGGWLSNYLGCARGNVIRGIAADSGGIPVAHPTCTGGAAAMEFPGDSAVTQDPQGNQIGVSVARDLFIQLNGCSTTPTNMMFGTASCQYYGGCSSPVVWCNTGGAHQAGNSYLSPSGWAFWSTLQ